ncbi:MAG: TatD family hydrolase [Bacteroidaceae bacterium]|nr:TatD family hydrolase [Bacteroidaceae bacterium]
MLIDTHSHLYGEEFSDDREDVLQRAQAAGVSKIFLPNINRESMEPMLQLAAAHPGFLYPMMGLHPEDLGEDWREVLAEMEQRLAQSNHPFIAIGEVGLDYYWDRSRYEEQQEALAIQIGWAVKYHLPLMIHTRSAHREMVDMISNRTLTGVFHCFAGTADEAEELLRFDGFCLGIGGVVTFKKSSLPETLRAVVPLTRIVLETDSPYLAPVPHRGKRNESAYVLEVAHRVAEIYNVSVDEVTQITTQNALHTFPKAC